MNYATHTLLFALLLSTSALGQFPVGFQELPLMPKAVGSSATGDWLLGGVDSPAGVYRSGSDLVLDNGLLRRTFHLVPTDNGCGVGTVALEDLSEDTSLLRAVRPEALVRVNDQEWSVGGLAGQPNHAYLDPDWVTALVPAEGALGLSALHTGPIEARMEWGRVRHHTPDANWPPAGVHLTLVFDCPKPVFQVRVHYALYHGLPAYSKWLEVENMGTESINLDRFTSEILAAVEHSSWVESRGLAQPHPDLHVETDFAFGGMSAPNANRLAVHWRKDPAYETQVNYERTTPCLLEVSPTLGPNQTIAPGAAWTSFRAFVMPLSGDRERRGLAHRKLIRTVAPWVTENPLMMHVRWSDDTTVRTAIDQCAEVGFEMVILTFGSGFDIEDESEANRTRMRALADYAHSKGIELGGYSLLSSRRLQPDSDNCIHPETGEPGGNIHGFCPALASDWGQTYFEKLYAFYESSGFSLLEHDGSWPGDPDAAARPPLQKGLADSRWVQWRIITDFYSWCRGRGIYLNVPDYYYLSGSNKCAMGYRETNWSLPRAQQLIHARQNMYDGTWQKTPSMGWMFVPLSEYHGGGEAATVEPLDEHLDHYAAMLTSHLALGIQACYRGPRLYDTPRTRDRVKQLVAWFKDHRRILEADLIHGRRADGKHLDWMLHADPRGATTGLLVVFNPTSQDRTRTLHVNAYYTGLTDDVEVEDQEGTTTTRPLRAGRFLDLEVTIPANSSCHFFLR
ncbi:MAG: alpha-galactosidase [bacterium]|nr:alpha-galactosidase [bacterium]